MNYLISFPTLDITPSPNYDELTVTDITVTVSDNRAEYPSVASGITRYGNFEMATIEIINTTTILSTGEGSIYAADQDLIYHFILKTDVFNYQSNIVFGGSGDYKTANIIDLNADKLLIYGIDGSGFYFVEIN